MFVVYLRGAVLRRQRLAGAERLLQFVLNCSCERVRASEHASRDPFRVLENRHGLAEVVERIEIESIAGQMRTLLAKIEADPPKSTAAVNKWWEILCDSASLINHQ